MKKMRAFFIYFLFAPVCAFGAKSDDCLEYKVTPDVSVGNIGWAKQVTQPDEDLPLVHGVTVATMTHQNNISIDVIKQGGGYCVVLTSVKTDFWYDFLVKIDKHHLRGSCTYNAVLEHEQQHIDVYLSTFEKFKDEEKKAIENAANSVMPVFIKDMSETSDILKKFNTELTEYPDVVLVDKKIETQNDVENKKIDTGKEGQTLKKCVNK